MKIVNIISLFILVSAQLVSDVEDKSFKSHYLDNERPVWVYTPLNYQKERLQHKGYPLLLVIDAEDYLSGPLNPTRLDDLIAQSEIQPLVVCYIGKCENEDELKCDATFSRFIGHELTPWIRQNWNVTAHPSKTVVAGQGWGGLSASYLALKNPTIFGRVLSESGAYWWSPDDAETPEWLTKQYKRCAKLPLQFYLSSSIEADNRMESFTRFKETLEKKGYPLMCKEESGPADLQDALVFLVGKSKPAVSK